MVAPAEENRALPVAAALAAINVDLAVKDRVVVGGHASDSRLGRVRKTCERVEARLVD